MSDEKPSLPDIARQVVVNVVAALVTAYADPVAGVAAQGVAPAVLAWMNRISASIGKRRIEHATETMMDAAEAAGARTPEEFIEFIEAALSDEEHQELLARALTIAQDTASRDKRRALGRALAAAASDTGTRVDDELLFIRALADLDEPHIRCLRIVFERPDRLPSFTDMEARHAESFGVTVDQYRKLRQYFQPDDQKVRGWSSKDIGHADSGLHGVAPTLLLDLERIGLVTRIDSPSTTAYEPELEINDLMTRRYAPTRAARLMLRRLEEPDTSR